MEKKTENGKDKPRYSVCEYCGEKVVYSENDRTLMAFRGGICPRHPRGRNQGKHKPYKGKPPYQCVFCHTEFPNIDTIHAMLGRPCAKNRTGFNEGNHTLSPEGLKTR